MSAQVERVHRVAVRIGQAERELTLAVADARAAGVSWQGIGDALGITRQAAQQRFGKASGPLALRRIA